VQHDGSKEYSSSTAPVSFLRVMSYKYVVHVVVVVDCGHRRRCQMLLLLLMMSNAVVVVIVEC
jgi:hypothetical protein